MEANRSQTLLGIVCMSSSLAIRTLTYVFLRWIPGHPFPPIILTLVAVYTFTFAFVQPIRTSQLVNKQRATSQSRSAQDTLSFFKSFVTGLPYFEGTFRNLFISSINVILLALVADVVYRGPLFYPSHEVSFCRVGYVSANIAQILIRDPNSSKDSIDIDWEKAHNERDGPRLGRVRLSHTLNTSELTDANDFTASFELEVLLPDTNYRYKLSNGCTGTFKTAPLPGVVTTSQSDVFTFLTTSCIKPRFPYHPFDHPLRISGLEHLANLIPQLKARFMLFLGDFVYIDVPRRFGSDAETYRREYRQVFASPSWPAVSKDLPWISVYDDHEIANDWDRNTTGVYSAAMNPWNIYHASVNPPAVRPGTTYYSFTQGPASFFLLDTRRYRSPEFEYSNESPAKTMLGQLQLQDLKAWLREEEPEGVKWKIVISSIPFTKNWKINAVDTWAGYLFERQLLLEAMWDAGSDGYGVVVLSGDRHEFAATRFPPPRGGRWPRGVAVHEFSTSPLSMFYLPVRTYWQSKGDEEDEKIAYLPDGNSKFSVVDVSRLREGEKGKLKLRLFVDGAEAWNYTVTSP
ncbi:MAG: hypothetical protein M1814_004610 [Vezdaea aestivalis]|nr:MAG: hypothetical protein M1814_004610 [Vezdaea aestivalis]